jgi:hypothetical protein
MKGKLKFPQQTYFVASILVITAVLLLAAWRITANLTFFTVDTGLRFIQVQEIIRQEWTTIAVDYPGRIYDSNLQHTPFYYSFSLIDNQIFLSVTPFLPFMAAILFAQTGPIGLLLLPVAGGVLIAAGLYKLGELCGLRHRLLLLWAAILATPVIFYSLTFWDHTIATALLLWGTYFWLRGLFEQEEQFKPGDWLAGGICFGLSLGQRPDAYLFVAAAGLALLLLTWRQWRTLAWSAAGGFAGVLPVWVSQYLWFGNPLGPVMAPTLTGYGRLASYPVGSYPDFPDGIPLSLKIGRLLFFVESGDPATFIALLALLAGLALIVLQLRLRPASPRLLPGLALLLLAYLIWMREAWQQPLPGLLTTFPLIPLSLTYIDTGHPTGKHRKVYHFILITLFIFLALALWSMPFGGVQWGARYLLAAYPLLLFLAFYVYERFRERVVSPRQLQLLFASLLVMGVVLQAVGLRSLWQKHAAEAEFQQFVAQQPVEWVLTSDPFLPSFMAALDDKSFLFVRDEEGLARLIPQLAKDGVTCFLLTESAPFPLTVPDQIDEITVEEVAPAVYALVPVAEGIAPGSLTTDYCQK